MGCLCSKGAKDGNINEKHLNKRKNKETVQLVAPSSTQEHILEGGNDGDEKSFVPKQLGAGDQLDATGWPSWLASVAGDAVKGWQPRRTDSFEKLEKVITLFLNASFTCFSIYRKFSTLHFFLVLI